MLGRGSGSRVIILGDGTEIHTDSVPDEDGDVDMHDRGEAEELEDKDLEEQVKKGQADAKNTDGESSDARSAREGTPGPDAASKDSAATEKAEEKKADAPEESKAEAGSTETTEEPKMIAAVDGVDDDKIKEVAQAKSAAGGE